MGRSRRLGVGAWPLQPMAESRASVQTPGVCQEEAALELTLCALKSSRSGELFFLDY